MLRVATLLCLMFGRDPCARASAHDAVAIHAAGTVVGATPQIVRTMGSEPRLAKELSKVFTASTARVALLQMNGTGLGPAERTAKAQLFAKEAAAAGAHLAVTPAGWLTGGAPAMVAMRSVARSSNIALAVASCSTADGTVDPGANGVAGSRQSLDIVAHTGMVVLTYTKDAPCIHDLHQEDEHGERAAPVPVAGDVVPPVALNLSNGLVVIVGGVLHSDLIFPEPARLLMIGGAELIVAPAGSAATMAGPLRKDAVQLLTQSRARENAAPVFVATAPSNAHGVLPGVPHFANKSVTPVGTPPALGREGVAYFDVDVGRIRRGRATTTVGDNYRRPFNYLPLCFESERAERPAASARRGQPREGARHTALPAREPEEPEEPNQAMHEAQDQETHDPQGQEPQEPQDLVVALLQLQPNTTFQPTDHTGELVAKADRFIRLAASGGADVALLPEMYSVGYEVGAVLATHFTFSVPCIVYGFHSPMPAKTGVWGHTVKMCL